MFEAHLTVWAFALALPKAGKSSPARIAMIAITTSNSISVKAPEHRRLAVAFEGLEGGSFMRCCRGHPTHRRCRLHTRQSSVWQDPDSLLFDHQVLDPVARRGLAD